MSKRKLTKLIIALLVISSAGGYLLYQLFSSTWVYYYTVDEFVNSPLYKPSASEDSNNPVIRIAGRAKLGQRVTMPFEFEVSGQQTSVSVRYNGPVPKNLTNDKEVVVEGRMGSDGVFSADKLLTRCESKYKVKLTNH